MDCKFDPSRCSATCKKYSICTYYSIQNQFSEIQSQLNFIYSTISKILNSNETAETKLNNLELAVSKLYRELYNDSYPKLNFKESDNEKENE